MKRQPRNRYEAGMVRLASQAGHCGEDCEEERFVYSGECMHERVHAKCRHLGIAVPDTPVGKHTTPAQPWKEVDDEC